MSRPHPLIELTLFRIREFVREPEALFWVFVFPVLLALALGVAFRERRAGPLRIAVVGGAGAAPLARALAGSPELECAVLPAEEALRRLRTGAAAASVEPGAEVTVRFDPARPESLAARFAVENALRRASGPLDGPPVRVEEVRAPGARYIDFLVPGLLGMNLMGTGMWGVGFSVVNARQKKLLKRLAAAPMRRSHYLAAQMAGRLVFLGAEVVVLVGFARAVFSVPFRGPLATFAAVCLAGALAFAGLGLLVAARPRTIEGVSGIMNFVMLPMWIGSGTFFSAERFPAPLQPLIQLLPLTAVNDALRAVMLEGAGFPEVAHELALIGAWTAVSFALALRWFRWS
ncbi:MAG: ABC transporter permease [Acidobacteria bacterium]|nr:MAG: ABC transporter permease [Acidobacteriota bacterium]